MFIVKYASFIQNQTLFRDKPRKKRSVYQTFSE